MVQKNMNVNLNGLKTHKILLYLLHSHQYLRRTNHSAVKKDFGDFMVMVRHKRGKMKVCLSRLSHQGYIIYNPVLIWI